MQTVRPPETRLQITDQPRIWENPLGLDGLDFIEFTGPQPECLRDLFANLGFTKLATHPAQPLELYGQGRIFFVLHTQPRGFAAEFGQAHGPSACATGFRVRDAKLAFELSVQNGATPVQTENPWSAPAVLGIGGSHIYFIDQFDLGQHHFMKQFDLAGRVPTPSGFGLEVLDHLTNNVPQGEMDVWCSFYENRFNFKQVRYFDIRGEKTGLVSKVMRSPCQKITIPINEPTDSKSQIQEYLDEYKGSGIQHIALHTSDIVNTVENLRSRGIEFLETPSSYYDLLQERLPNLTENIEDLRRLQILADGDEDGYLLQIFTKNMIGPIFFEIIQRKNHSGFGEGNFQALFDAIERDQKKRGYL